jgi:hypothetical protein
MKFLERIYNWLSDKDPTDRLKKFKRQRLIEQSFDNSNPDFCIWAFGNDYEQLSNDGRMMAWNVRHGDKLFIEQVDQLYDNRLSMGKLWVDHVSANADQSQPKV